VMDNKENGSGGARASHPTAGAYKRSVSSMAEHRV
jgi:hypothetical protein